jgi:hypothetical protein
MISELAGDGWRFELGGCRRFVVWTGKSGRAIVDENERGTRNAR